MAAQVPLEYPRDSLPKCENYHDPSHFSFSGFQVLTFHGRGLKRAGNGAGGQVQGQGWRAAGGREGEEARRRRGGREVTGAGKSRAVDCTNTSMLSREFPSKYKL